MFTPRLSPLQAFTPAGTRTTARTCACACLCALGWSLAPLQGAVVWNESVHGDLSVNPAAPTSVTFITGQNTIIGSISGPIVSNVSGYDEATFTIPANYQVFSITLDSYGPDPTNMSLLNLYEGAQGADLGTLIASATLEIDHVGRNLLDAATATVAPAGPLQAGTYTLDIREGGALQDYQITVDVALIPEPSTALLAGLGFGLLALRHRRRRR